MLHLRGIRLWIGLGILGSTLGAGLGLPRWLAPDAGIRVVDHNRVLSKMTEAKKLLVAMAQEEERAQVELAALQEQLETLGLDIGTATEGSSEYRELVMKFDLLRYELDLQSKSSGERLRRLQAESMLSLFKKIQAAMEEYRQQNGLALMLLIQTDDGKDLMMNAEAVSQHVNSKTVTTWDPALDVTDAIIDMLN
ncbi:MAG: OmpH family outer membrane protein [Planctomycetota bacterium]